MAALTAAIIAATVVAASASTYQAVNANQQKQDAKGLANKQEDQAKADAAAADKLTTDANNADKNAQIEQQAKARQQSIMGSSAGRGSTILTSPLGAPPAANTAGKTLLGM